MYEKKQKMGLAKPGITLENWPTKQKPSVHLLYILQAG